jgi:integrase
MEPSDGAGRNGRMSGAIVRGGGRRRDLALVGAATPAAVSRALGHESQEVTFRHYADRGLADQQQHLQAMEMLAPYPTIN